MVTDIRFFGSKDDRYFLSGSLDGKIRLWNIPDKKVTMWNELSGPSNLITTANFCHNGRLAVVGTYDGRCIFYTTDVSRAGAGSDHLAVFFCMSLSLVSLPISNSVCRVSTCPDGGGVASVWGLFTCALVLVHVPHTQGLHGCRKRVCSPEARRGQNGLNFYSPRPSPLIGTVH